MSTSIKIREEVRESWGTRVDFVLAAAMVLILGLSWCFYRALSGDRRATWV